MVLEAEVVEHPALLLDLEEMALLVLGMDPAEVEVEQLLEVEMAEMVAMELLELLLLQLTFKQWYTQSLVLKLTLLKTSSYGMV